MPPKAAKAASPELSKLQDSWKTMFQKTLPSAATSKSPDQPHWPVHVDHCFARIILDNVVGESKAAWMSVIKSPAYKNMSEAQLKAAIQLGEDILSGTADLVELDEESLQVRGKKGKKNAMGRKSGKMSKEDMKEAESQRKENEEGGDNDEMHETKSRHDGTLAEEETRESGRAEQKLEPASDNDVILQADVTNIIYNPPKNTQSADNRKRKHSADIETSPSPSPPAKSPKTASRYTPYPSLQSKITSSSKTPFQKSVLSLLLQIPPGHYTTYALLSSHLSSSPRAIGNAIRNNPFAPDVPCHRVLATGGGIGGFGGSWGRKGEEGKNDREKFRLLRSEGVKFDEREKAVDKPWGDFK